MQSHTMIACQPCPGLKQNLPQLFVGLKHQKYSSYLDVCVFWKHLISAHLLYLSSYPMTVWIEKRKNPQALRMSPLASKGSKSPPAFSLVVVPNCH